MKRMMYLDRTSNEIENLINGTKDVIIRAANIKKFPYKMVDDGDKLYLLPNDSKVIVRVSATVNKAIFIETTNEKERLEIFEVYKNRVKLNKKKTEYILKRKYISIFILSDIKEEYAKVDKSQYGLKEDWLEIIDVEKG